MAKGEKKSGNDERKGDLIDLVFTWSVEDMMNKDLITDKVVFDEPNELPPQKSHDHHISLAPGSSPPNIRPYGYQHFQKKEIEKITREMLQARFICHSTNPYSSLVLLVRKKDGSWRMCVDYRELNKLTIKDKFTIPVIDELLEELHGAHYFTKLDLLKVQIS